MNANGNSPQHEGSADRQKGSRVASRRGTGPRTRIGKDRTKYNALKHGLFAKVVLLSHEPQSQFYDLLQGLQHDLTPQGTLERALVEKLATILWRYRRFLQAERADVQKNIEVQVDDNAGLSRRSQHIKVCVEKEIAETNRRGSLPGIDEFPESLEYCLDKLYDLSEEAETYGLEREIYSTYLGLIYGARYSGRPGEDLFDYYLECLSAVNATAAERERRGFASEVDCVKKFIAATEREIRRLEHHRKHPLPKPKPDPLIDEEQAGNMGLLKWAIPDSDEQDRLSRYEATLERGFDRVLIQLERLQRMRDNQKTIELTHQTTTSD